MLVYSFNGQDLGLALLHPELCNALPASYFSITSMVCIKDANTLKQEAFHHYMQSRALTSSGHSTLSSTTLSWAEHCQRPSATHAVIYRSDLITLLVASREKGHIIPL